MNIGKYSNKIKYPGYLNIVKYLPELIPNLINDTELSDKLKYEFLDSVSILKLNNKDHVENACRDFFEKKQLLGTICKNCQKQNSYLRVHSKPALIAWISQIIGLMPIQVSPFISTILYSSNAILKNKLLEKLLNIEAVNDSYFVEENCIKFFGLASWKAKRKPILADAFLLDFNNIQWSFPDSKIEDLFHDQKSIDIIPCRAGLSFEGDKIIYSHDLSDVYNVRKPTMFDACLYPQFQPGGMTKPLSKCNSHSGFSEFVHKPNNFKNINTLKAETFHKL